MTAARKVPAYLITAPTGDFMADMSLTAARLIPELSLLICEDTGDNDNCLVNRLRTQKIIRPELQVIPIDNALPNKELRDSIDRCVSQEKPFALMPDSGIASFIDPGIHVVRYLLDNFKNEVELIPVGAGSAMDAAIMASGVDCTRFIFMGHFPENIMWFPVTLGAGIPGIAYVRGDEAGRFDEAANHIFGPDSELHVTIFGDIRSRYDSFQGRYPLNNMPRLHGKPGTDGPGELQNFVFILHHPWKPEFIQEK